MKMDWKNLKRLNPHAIQQSNQTGNWFLKEGAVIKNEESFKSLLQQKQKVNMPTLAAEAYNK